jgi:hypothetical protein
MPARNDKPTSKPRGRPPRVLEDGNVGDNGRCGGNGGKGGKGRTACAAPAAPAPPPKRGGHSVVEKENNAPISKRGKGGTEPTRNGSNVKPVATARHRGGSASARTPHPEDDRRAADNMLAVAEGGRGAGRKPAILGIKPAKPETGALPHTKGAPCARDFVHSPYAHCVWGRAYGAKLIHKFAKRTG